MQERDRGATGSGSTGSPSQRAWNMVRRPADMAGSTRWLFGLCASVILLVTLIPMVSASTSVTARWVDAGAAAVLAVSWAVRYRRGKASVAGDVVDVLALLAIATAAPDPGAALGITFPALWFRSLYGSSTVRVLLYCGGAMAALLSVQSLRVAVGLAGSSSPQMLFLGVVPGAFLTTLVARNLAVALFTREQSQRRDAALARFGADLLGAGHRDVIYARAWETVSAICAATPGLRALGLQERPDRLQVVLHAGPLADVRSALPRDLLPEAPTVGGPGAAVQHPALSAAAPVRWSGFRVPEQADRWLLVGAPGPLPTDVVMALWSLLTSVALAVRTTDAHRSLSAQAHTDPLTGLANRSAFFTALEERVRDRRRRPVVLFLDLDDFKSVNDRLGHSAGDELLRRIGERVRLAVRPGDLCARLGGDEFAVLLPDEVEARTVAERLVRVVAEPLDLAGRHAAVGVSIGLATLAPESSVEQLVHRADVAMYAAKAKGKNRVQVFEASLLQADAQALLEAELRGAVSEGQIVVHYQPVVSVLDGHPTAVEALVRWQHPSRGLLGPAEFVPTAERSGAIREIGAFVLRQACADLALLTDAAGAPLDVHVNLSAAQVTEPDFLAEVEQALSVADVGPRQLVFEITESEVLDTPVVRAGLDELVRRLGVTLAVDDFGTGYSALTTLRTLPLHVVKIDRSFVAGCPTSTADRSVVEAIVHMARQLGLRTIAEGVERPEQQEFLRDVGVGAAQGFLHLRPVPVGELAGWLQARARGGGRGARVRTLPQRTG